MEIKLNSIESWVLLDALQAYLATQDKRKENYPAIAESLLRQIDNLKFQNGKSV